MYSIILVNEQITLFETNVIVNGIDGKFVKVAPGGCYAVVNENGKVHEFTNPITGKKDYSCGYKQKSSAQKVADMLNKNN